MQIPELLTYLQRLQLQANALQWHNLNEQWHFEHKCKEGFGFLCQLYQLQHLMGYTEDTKILGGTDKVMQG